jgi:hypothetical protein
LLFPPGAIVLPVIGGCVTMFLGDNRMPAQSNGNSKDGHYLGLIERNTGK